MPEEAKANSIIRVLIADDQQLMREGLRTLLELESDIEIAGEAEDGAAAIAAHERLKPDVTLMDIRMPKLDGVEATKRIREMAPQAKILILTTFDEDELVFEAIRAGARGYLLKDLSGSELANAIREVHAGGATLQPSIARKLMDAFVHTSAARPKAASGAGLLDSLSSREKAVLRLLSRGLSNKEIATRLFLAEGTVKNHVSLILQKIDARDRTQAALKARELGLIADDKEE